MEEREALKEPEFKDMARKPTEATNLANSGLQRLNHRIDSIHEQT